MKEQVKGKGCPWEAFHNPNEKVYVGRTTIRQIQGPDGRMRTTEQSEEEIVRYGEWEGRCRTCYPREE